MKTLLIEDDQYTSNLLSAMLSDHHYVVDTIADGALGLELALQWNYDLILLDVLLPTLSGIEICRQLRAQGNQTPILMLTAQNSNEAIIAGLDAGADDYVAKSCDMSQLLARMRALLRRGSKTFSSPLLTWGQLQLDPTCAQVTYNQKPIALRPKEYSLLELFLRHPQRILSRSNIIDHLWPMEETPVEGSVTNLIKDLRHRLKSAGMAADFIETVYGLGYRLKTAPAEQHEEKRAEQHHSWEHGALTAISSVKADKDWQIREKRGIAAIHHIADRFRISLDQRIAVLEAAAQSFQTGYFSSQQQNAVREEAHKLAGGLGTFGYDRASEIARAIEQLVAKASPDRQMSHQYIQLLEKLRQELARPAAHPSMPEASLVNQ